MNFIDDQPQIRATIDQWPVANSGLSPRVVHCAAHAGIQTIGQLRSWSDSQLLNLRHFGVTSLENVKWFFRLTRKLEQGDYTQFPDFAAITRAFLNKQETLVLEQRFSLTDPLFRPNMRRRTLQSIADELGGMTRERVRQIEEEGIRNLRSFLCRELLAPLEQRWSQAIQNRGGVITSPELTEWTTDPALGGYQPWGLLLLLTQVSDGFHLHFDYYSTLTPKALGRLESQAIAILQTDPAIVRFAELRDRLRQSIDDPGGQLDRVLKVVLDHHPDICGTVNGDYFLATRGTPEVIREILRFETQPVHFRDLTARFNERMIPNSRRGSGFVLRTLNLMPQVQRADRAMYQLAPA